MSRKCLTYQIQGKLSVQCYDNHDGDEDDKNPNSSAAETHAKDCREIFEGVARLGEVETSVVTRGLACKIMLKPSPKSKGESIIPNPAMISFPRGGCTSKKFVLLMYLNILC